MKIVLKGRPLNQKNIDKFLDQFFDETWENPMNPKQRVYDNSCVIHIVPKSGNEIYVSDIRSLRTSQGYGTKALEWLTDLADEHKVTLTLNAINYGSGPLDDKMLINWYKKFGFKRSGDNYMIRKPQ